MLPNVDHLRELAADEDAFERERNRIISEYLKSLPPERRMAAYATQIQVDLARETMSSDELLVWMCREAAEKLENLSDQFQAVRNRLVPPSTQPPPPAAP
jgi:hypothetical protein